MPASGDKILPGRQVRDPGGWSAGRFFCQDVEIIRDCAPERMMLTRFQYFLVGSDPGVGSKGGQRVYCFRKEAGEIFCM